MFIATYARPDYHPSSTTYSGLFALFSDHLFTGYSMHFVSSSKYLYPLLVYGSYENPAVAIAYRVFHGRLMTANKYRSNHWLYIWRHGVKHPPLHETDLSLLQGSRTLRALRKSHTVISLDLDPHRLPVLHLSVTLSAIEKSCLITHLIA